MLRVAEGPRTFETSLCHRWQLVDARFLLRLASVIAGAKAASGAQQQRLPSRCELPEAAFINPGDLRRMTETGFGALRILCVSQPWLRTSMDWPLEPLAAHLPCGLAS